MKSKEIELLKSKVNGIIADKEALIFHMGASFCAVYLTLGAVFAMAENLLFAGLSFTGFFISMIGIKFLDFEYEMEKPKPIKEESDPDTEDGIIKLPC